MTSVTENLSAVKTAIDSSCKKAGRDGVSLVAVSKTQPVEAVLEAVSAGQRVFGENYVQEGVAKIAAAKEALPDTPLEWHFIGPLQANKTKPVAENFDWVHTIDRERIARRLSEQRPADLPPLNVLVQVNVSGEESKSGVSPDETEALCSIVAALPNLKLRGLMAIPEPETDPVKQKIPFAKMKSLFDALIAKGYALDTLSMGMSADMDAAISEGASLVRIGTAVFGARDYSKKK